MFSGIAENLQLPISNGSCEELCQPQEENREELHALLVDYKKNGILVFGKELFFFEQIANPIPILKNKS